MHTVRHSRVGLYEQVLSLGTDIRAASWSTARRVMVAGLASPTRRSVKRQRLGRIARLPCRPAQPCRPQGWKERDTLIAALREQVAAEIPLIGFYLQPAVGGLHLSLLGALCRHRMWWRSRLLPSAAITAVDVVRGIVDAGAETKVTLYTGNDDRIVLDLVTPFTVMRDSKPVAAFQRRLNKCWSVWTKGAVDIFKRCRAERMRRMRFRPTCSRSIPA